MDFNLCEHHKMIRNAAKDFADKSVRPIAAEIDRRCEFPSALVKQMGQMGYFGLQYPAKYGGSDAGYIGLALAAEQLSQASMVTGAIMGVMSLTGEALLHHSTEKQKETFLKPMASGDMLASFAFTEAATGSDPSSIETKAQLHGGDYIISGQKQFVAMAHASNLALVFARDETERISAFMVDTSSPGFEIRHPCATMGARGLCPSVVYLDDMRIPKKNMVGKKSDGYNIMLEAMSIGKLVTAAEAVGVAQEALDLSLAYARERTAYQRPIGDLLSIKWLLAEMHVRIEASRLLAYEAAALRDEGKSIMKESATAKLFASQSAVDVTRMAMQVHGAYGYMSDMAVERLYRDAKLTEIYEGVSEIQRTIIANSLLRDNA
ncbi:MAG: acyl-CoA dehydrogenase family protein [Dehalococcoidia bacterium]|jgi:butyryl-CoA dehydrogenase